MAHHSSESMMTDHMAAIIARTLVQLFGDEDIDQTAIVARYSTPMNRKKKVAYSNEVVNGVENSSSSSSSSSVERVTKKRRYRSIDNLYMATKPVNFLEGKEFKYCS